MWQQALTEVNLNHTGSVLFSDYSNFYNPAALGITPYRNSGNGSRYSYNYLNYLMFYKNAIGVLFGFIPWNDKYLSKQISLIYNSIRFLCSTDDDILRNFDNLLPVNVTEYFKVSRGEQRGAIQKVWQMLYQ